MRTRVEGGQWCYLVTILAPDGREVQLAAYRDDGTRAGIDASYRAACAAAEGIKRGRFVGTDCHGRRVRVNGSRLTVGAAD